MWVGDTGELHKQRTPSLLFMSRQVKTIGRRKHLPTDRMKALAVSSLARKVGYLRVDDFPITSIFNTLPTQSYSADRIIRGKEELFIIKEGSVEIWHRRYEKLVSELGVGVLFGEIALLGQTMLGARAIAGKLGAVVALMDIEATKKWIESNPVSIFSELGYRLSSIEAEYYRSQLQLADSRIAALLLELADKNSVIEGISHQELGERLGLYRETVTVILDSMKLDKLIEVGRMRIAILDKRAVREMSEL